MIADTSSKVCVDMCCALLLATTRVGVGFTERKDAARAWYHALWGGRLKWEDDKAIIQKASADKWDTLKTIPREFSKIRRSSTTNQ